MDEAHGGGRPQPPGWGQPPGGPPPGGPPPGGPPPAPGYGQGWTPPRPGPAMQPQAPAYGGYPPPAGSQPWGPGMAGYGAPPPDLPPGVDWNYKDRKIAAGICGILFGVFGVHKFVLGYITEGVIMAAATLGSYALMFVAFFVPFIAAAGSNGDEVAGAWVGVIFALWGIAFAVIFAVYIIGLIEGIMYLTKSDYEFVMRYRANHRGWF